MGSPVVGQGVTVGRIGLVRRHACTSVSVEGGSGAGMARPDGCIERVHPDGGHRVEAGLGLVRRRGRR